MSAIYAYQNNDAYAGLQFFAYDLNDILAKKRPKTAEVEGAIMELDAIIKNPANADSSCENMILYRGCTFQAGNPAIRDGVFCFRQYLSTSTSLLQALHSASSCDSIYGETKVLKIIYPRNKPYLKMRETSENEILLPRDCTFTSAAWNLTADEQMIWGLCSSIKLQPKVNRLQLLA